MNRQDERAPWYEREGSRLFLLAILSCAVYLNSMYGDFLLDDEILIPKNEAIRSVFHVDFFTYRWVRTFSYAMDYLLWGLNPIGYHLSNIVYNSLTVLVVFFLTRRLTHGFWTAYITALIFAVHPIHTEAVSYLSGRRDILSALFFLLGFHVYLKVRERNRLGGYLLVLGCYLTAISAKEMAVTLPILIIAYEVIQTVVREGRVHEPLFLVVPRSLWHNLVRFRAVIIAVMVLMAGYLYMVLFVQRASGMVAPDAITWWGGSAASNFATTACVLLAYVKKLFFPVLLQVDYHQFPYYTSFLLRPVLFALGVGIVLLVSSFAMIRRNWHVTFAIWFFFITLLPVMHIIPHHILMAEHYLYLPSYGYCLAAGILMHALIRQHKFRAGVVATLVLVCSLYAFRTVDRNLDWTDTITLMDRSLKYDPDNPIYHFFLGRAYNIKHLGISAGREMEKAVGSRYNHAQIHATRAVIAYNRGDYATGEIHTERALGFNPNEQMTLFNQGLFAMFMGDKEKALQSYSKIPTDYKEGSHLQNMAAIYLEEGKWTQAEEALLKGLRSFPERVEFHHGLGEVAVKKLDFERAEREYRLAELYARSRPDLRTKLADLPEKIRWTRKLKVQYDKALGRLAEDPKGALGHYLLAEVYWAVRNCEAAEQHLRRARDRMEAITGADALMVQVLSERGNSDEALVIAEKIAASSSSPREALLIAAACFVRFLRFERAIEVYERVVKQQGLDGEGARLGEVKKIRSLWERSQRLAAEGDSAAAVLVKGEVYRKLGMHAKAIECYESAPTERKQDLSVLLEMFDLYLISGYPYRNRALAAGEKILELDPGCTEVAWRLGDLFYNEVEDYESALRYYQMAMDNEPVGAVPLARVRAVETLRQYVKVNGGVTEPEFIRVDSDGP